MDPSTATDAVVVGVDTSPQAGRAARFAADTAARQGLALVVAHGWTRPLFEDVATEADVQAAHDAGAKVVADVVTELDLGPDAVVRTVLELDDPVHLLSVLSEDARQVVVGRHDHWVDRLWDGAVSSALSRSALCPVVSVPDRWTPHHGGTPLVVAAVDTDDTSRGVLDTAFAEADRRGADLVVLHATSTDPSEDGRRDVERELAEVLGGYREAYPQVGARTGTVFGRAVGQADAWSERADLLVVGRPHPGRHHPRWIGSTTSLLLTRTWCPLVVVPTVEVPR